MIAKQQRMKKIYIPRLISFYRRKNGKAAAGDGFELQLVFVFSDFFISILFKRIAKLGAGSDVPYRGVVHPGRDGLIYALLKSCRKLVVPFFLGFNAYRAANELI